MTRSTATILIRCREVCRKNKDFNLMKPYNFMWLPRRHSPHRALCPNGVPGSAGEAAGAAAPGLGRIEAWKVPLFSLLPAMAGGKHGPGMLKFGHVKEL